MTIDGNFIDEKDGYIFNDGGQRVYLAEDSGAKEDAINFLLDKPVSERFLYEKSGLDFIQKLIAKDDCASCDEKTGEVTVNENGECLDCGESPVIPDVAKPKEITPANDNLIPSPSDNLPADTKNEFAFLGFIALAFLAFLGFNVKG